MIRPETPTPEVATTRPDDTREGEADRPHPSPPDTREEVERLRADLDALLVEEDRMHPIGCSTWEEQAFVTIDRAKDMLESLLSSHDRLSGEVEAAWQHVENVSARAEAAEQRAIRLKDLALTERSGRQAAEQQRDEAMRKLEPFAAFAGCLHDDKTGQFYGVATSKGAAEITFEHLRAALRLLHPEQGES